VKPLTLRLEPRQFGTPEPSPWENELADVLEATFAAGVHDLDGVVAALNASRVRAVDGGAWSADSFKHTMRKLGA
jgi:hypothetical protein